MVRWSENAARLPGGLVLGWFGPGLRGMLARPQGGIFRVNGGRGSRPELPVPGFLPRRWQVAERCWLAGVGISTGGGPVYGVLTERDIPAHWGSGSVRSGGFGA